MMAGRGKMRIAALAAVVLAIGGAGELRAQVGGCTGTGINTSDCFAVQQALVSAQPQVGIAMAGGSPLLGTASVGGVRLGFVPRLTAGLRVNAAWMSLPDLRAGDGAGGYAARRRTDVVTVVGADAAVSVFEGVTSGSAGGIGALDVLLSAGVLPASGGITDASYGWGVGLRAGLLRETFGMPGVSVSAMYRGTGSVRYAGTCKTLACTAGTAAALDFDVRDVSTRLTVAKRVGPLGLVAGAGLDHFTDDSAHSTYTSGTVSQVHERELSDNRWSLFADAAYALPVGSLIVEGGWMGGGKSVSGYTSQPHAYDPGSGTLFGSIGVRLSL